MEFVDFDLEKAKQASAVSFDIEHNPNIGPHDPGFTLHGCSFCYRDGKKFARIYLTDLQEIFRYCREIFNSDAECIAHNGKYDVKCLHAAGLEFSCYPKVYLDTMVGMNLLEDNRRPNQLGLKYLIKEIFGHQMTEFSEASAAGLDSPLFLDYALEDSIWELLLWEYLRPRLVKANLFKVAVRIICPASLVLADVERAGLKFSIDKGQELFNGYRRVRNKLLADIRKELGGVNPDSPSQLSTLFFETLQLSSEGVSRTPKGDRFSVDDAALEKLAPRHKAAKLISSYRKSQKVLSTYVVPLMEKALHDPVSRIHPTFWVVSTTGRTRSDSPNFQNLPSGTIEIEGYSGSIRSCFVAEPGWTYLIADQSQVELRLIAHITKDKQLAGAYLKYRCGSCQTTGTSSVLLRACPKCGATESDKILKDPKAPGFWHGLDLHTLTAENVAALGGNRQMGKCVDPDTLVFVDGLYKTIGEVSDVHRDNEFVPAIHTVFDGDGFAQSDSCFYQQSVDKCVVVSRQGVVVCTPEHKFLTQEGSWKRAQDLSIDDSLAPAPDLPEIPSKPFVLEFNPFDPTAKPFASVAIDSRWGYFMGILTGDGLFSSSDQVSICCGSGTPEYQVWGDRLRKSIEEIGLPIARDSVYSRNGRPIRILYIGSRRVANFLKCLGFRPKRSGNACIPHVVYKSREIALGYVAGLVDTDGYAPQKSKGGGFVFICNKSPVFAGQLLTVVRALGDKHAYIKLSYNKTYRRYYYDVCLSPDFMRHVVPYMQYQKKIDRVLELKRLKPYLLHNKILGVCPHPAGAVCDLSIPESRKYVANTLVTHNTANFALIYAATARTMNNHYPAASIRKWQEIIDDWFEFYSGVYTWHQQCIANCQATGECRDPFNRRRTIPKHERFAKHSSNQYINFAPQAGACDLMLLSMRRLHKQWVDSGDWMTNVRIVNFVHDELVVECRDEMVDRFQADLVTAMEGAATFYVPLRADVKRSKHYGVK